MFVQLLITLLTVIKTINSLDFIVDGTIGDDLNNGQDIDHAFKTIKRCVENLVNPGDKCSVRGGRYHETIHIEGVRAPPKDPVIISGYEDEWPIWDGTVPIQPHAWIFDETSNICSTGIEDDITALFLDDELLTPSRWPNALWSDKTIFDNKNWRPCDHASTHGNIVDKLLAESGIDATGAMAILNVGSFDTWVREVTKHGAGSDNFDYNHDFGDNIHWRPNHNQYYLEASLALLDAPGEWYYDVKTKVLHVIPPDEKSCGELISLRGRTIDYGITITNSSGLTLSNFIFHGANIDAEGEGHMANNHITLDSLQMKFPSSSHRMLKEEVSPLVTKVMAGTKHSHPGTVTVTNCTFTGAEGAALVYTGTETLIHNNLFTYNDWTGQGLGGTVMSSSTRGVFSDNTLKYNGAAHGMRYTGRGSNITNNFFVGQCSGNIQSDGASIQVSTGAQNGVSISYNWIHNSPKKGIRFDGSGHPMGVHGYQGYNVVWDIIGNNEIYIKGDNHTVVNNLAFDNNVDDNQCSLCVVPIHSHTSMNNHSIVLNNAASHMAGGGGLKENNYEGKDVKQHMVDPDNHDFRPIQNGALDQGDIAIGPYQPGSNNLAYSIPGRKLYKTSFPIPGSGSTVPKTREMVMCREGFMATKHHFYFGETFSGVEAAGMDDDEFQFSLDFGNMFQLADLASGTEYFWRIDAEKDGEIQKGDIWNFTTM